MSLKWKYLLLIFTPIFSRSVSEFDKLFQFKNYKIYSGIDFPLNTSELWSFNDFVCFLKSRLMLVEWFILNWNQYVNFCWFSRLYYFGCELPFQLCLELESEMRYMGSYSDRSKYSLRWHLNLTFLVCLYCQK